MKNRKLKIDEGIFRELLLDKYVDKNGDKVSVRNVWGDKDFMLYTGMFKKNKYTNKLETVSEGTISYYNKKLDLTEKYLFEYHKTTGRIKEDVLFEDWSRKNNNGHKRDKLNLQNSIKNKMIKYFGLTEVFKQYTPHKVQTLCERLVGFDEMKQFYERLDGDING